MFDPPITCTLRGSASIWTQIRLNEWCIYPPRARLSSCPSLTTKRHLVNIPPSSKPLLSQQFRPPQAPRLNKKSVGFILFRPVDVTETISILKYTLQPFIRSGRQKGWKLIDLMICYIPPEWGGLQVLALSQKVLAVCLKRAYVFRIPNMNGYTEEIECRTSHY